MKRFGQVTRVKPKKLEEYKRLHANAWPGVLKMITECNIRNYSLFHRDHYLFAYFEYIGDDFESDMAKMAEDPETRRWWDVCVPCLDLTRPGAEGEWWSDMEEVFHHD